MHDNPSPAPADHLLGLLDALGIPLLYAGSLLLAFGPAGVMLLSMVGRHVGSQADFYRLGMHFQRVGLICFILVAAGCLWLASRFSPREGTVRILGQHYASVYVVQRMHKRSRRLGLLYAVLACGGGGIMLLEPLLLNR